MIAEMLLAEEFKLFVQRGDEVMRANDMQVGGDHYKQQGLPEHWDLVCMYDWDYFQAQVVKYVMRWKYKYAEPAKQLEDLKKARHFLDKYIEEYTSRFEAAGKLQPEDDLGPRLTVKSALQVMDRKPDGWVGYTYEGGDSMIDFYRCKSCLLFLKVPIGANPNDHHKCEAGAATPAYVNQG